MKKIKVTRKDMISKINTVSDNFIAIVGNNVYAIKNKGEVTGFKKINSSICPYLISGTESEDKYHRFINETLNLFAKDIEGVSISDEEIEPIELKKMEFLYNVVSDAPDSLKDFYVFT